MQGTAEAPPLSRGTWQGLHSSAQAKAAPAPFPIRSLRAVTWRETSLRRDKMLPAGSKGAAFCSRPALPAAPPQEWSPAQAPRCCTAPTAAGRAGAASPLLTDSLVTLSTWIPHGTTFGSDNQ